MYINTPFRHQCTYINSVLYILLYLIINVDNVFYFDTHNISFISLYFNFIFTYAIST